MAWEKAESHPVKMIRYVLYSEKTIVGFGRDHVLKVMGGVLKVQHAVLSVSLSCIGYHINHCHP